MDVTKYIAFDKNLGPVLTDKTVPIIVTGHAEVVRRRRRSSRRQLGRRFMAHGAVAHIGWIADGITIFHCSGSIGFIGSVVGARASVLVRHVVRVMDPMDIFDYVGAISNRTCRDKRACGILGNELNTPAIL